MPFKLLLSCYLFHNLIVGADTLQVAFRYHYASSAGEYGLTLNKRYEQKVVSGRGDTYNSMYLGLNYLVCQQKLKFMAGLEYFDMSGVADEQGISTDGEDRNVDGWTFITGMRLYF